MANQVHLISAASLLNENYRRELRSTGRLRPMANQNDFIWQQMPLEFLGILMEHKQLNLRAYGEYSNYDEMKFRNFCSSLAESKIIARQNLENYYKSFEGKLYISCWYSSRDLSDIGFKTYAHNKSGIAIGTTVSKLCEALRQGSLNGPEVPKISRIICGNVQYIPQRDMLERVIFDPVQTFAPIFTKGSQFQMDREFRVCIELSSGQEYRYNSDRNVAIRQKKYERAVKRLGRFSKKRRATPSQSAEKITNIINSTEWPVSCKKAHIDLLCDPAALIQYVALKDDGVFHEMRSGEIISLFQEALAMKFENPEPGKNGFQIYKLKGVLS